jgi:hypothetical protein
MSMRLSAGKSGWRQFGARGVFAMATQFVGSSLQSSAIGVNHAGVVLGCLFGGMHLGWAVLVAAGVAQPIADFVFWLHFIKPVWVIESFEPFRAAGLIVLTTAIGYLIGSAFALIWNHLHRAQA